MTADAPTTTLPLRVLLAKVGLDGHDRGVKVVARMLRDAGFEVVYLGRRQTPEQVARAAEAEDVDVVGLSVLSGTHTAVAREVVAALAAYDLDVTVVLGGTVLRREIDELRTVGIDAVFPVGTRLEEIQAYFSELTARRTDA
ncbi:MAG TPA: cobalamin-dependent protein [Acidimicrobiales bacterium]|nr:cobalamin-dependent protein [Acidimicrobiales bacterium]